MLTIDLVSFNRKVQVGHTIGSSSPPITLPKGSYIAVAAGPIACSEAVYDSPEKFDGFRFHRMRHGPQANSHAHQFVNTGLDNMTFGHGRFACPGRFFASNESKIILGMLLLEYEVKFGEAGQEGGREGRGAEKRPANQVFADACFPDAKVKMLIRKRRGS